MNEKQHITIPLTGKLNTAVDPIKLQPNDFQELINLRPTDDAPKGVRGMTKINTAATEYKGIRTGYHFKKDQPTENHIIVQTNDTVAPATASRLIKSDSSAVIPNQDTFSTFKALDNNNPCYITKAPDGCVAISNGTKNYIWGGNESRCYGFIVFDPNNLTTLYDYTDKVNNTLTDAANVATLTTVGGGIDAYTMACYHFDNNYDDSSGKGHTLTASGTNFTSSAGALLMGTHSLNADGNPVPGDNAYRDITADADFDCSAGAWTISTTFRPDQAISSYRRGIWLLYKDADNYAHCYFDTNGAVHVSVIAATAQVLGTDGMVSPNNVIKVNTTHTIEVGRDGSDNWYLFVDGVLQASLNDSSNLAGDYVTLRIATCNRSGAHALDGTLDEWKLDKGICRHTTSYAPMTTPFSTSSECDVYIASTRPLKGCKMYVGTPNATAATVSGAYWNGAWSALTITDNTDTVAGKTLSGTGTITWTDTVSDAKVKIINNQQYYWYKLVFTGIDATTTIYSCTLDADIQEIKDIWDGSLRTCLSMMTYTSTYGDYTTNVLQNDYISTDTGTFLDIDDMTSSQYMIFGFFERTMAIYLGFAEGLTNTTASTTATVYYWNGAAWTSVGTLDDGTSQAGISISRSGIISWDAPAEALEYTWTPNNGTPLYYYKIVFSQTINNSANNVYLNYVAGIPAQTAIHAYKFPLFWQNRLFLCGDQSGRKNRVRYTAGDTNCVLNGMDSSEFSVDGDDELMAGATLFTRFGGDVYDSAILCKRGQTFLLDNDPDNASMFTVKTVSTSKGCVAPYTMKLCDIGFDIASNIRKHILIWLSDAGLVVFDGVSMGTISDFFQNIFDPLDTNYINRTYIDDAYGEFDPIEQEYILTVPIGATPTWKELHYKLKQQSPFWVDRGTGKALRCAFPVEDSNGNKYMYGGTNDGYIERLEYGQSMDGNGIAYTMHLADIDFNKDALKRSSVEAIQLIGKSKNSTTKVTATHYVDGVTTGTTASSTISQVDTTHRIFRSYFPTSGTFIGTFHSTKFTITTTNENRGFEPLLVSYIWTEQQEQFD
jgi:hypothetical protein